MENTTVTLATPDSRSQVSTGSNITLADLLAQNNVNTSHASVMIDGTPLSGNQLNQTLAELGAGSDCTVSVTVKMQNANK